MRRLGEFRGVQQIDGDLPVGQGLADLGSDKGPLPGGVKTRMRKRHRFGGVIQQRDTNLLAQRRLDFLDHRLKFPGQPRQGNLRAKNVVRVERRPVPKEHAELVIHESGECSFILVADELAEFCFRRRDLRDLLLVVFRGRGTLDRRCRLLGRGWGRLDYLGLLVESGVALGSDLQGGLRRRIGQRWRYRPGQLLPLVSWLNAVLEKLGLPLGNHITQLQLWVEGRAIVQISVALIRRHRVLGCG